MGRDGMAKVRNILFIMSDQLRWDYLSCYGHPRLATPNIDGLAERGVRFDRAYVQAAVCGPSRMSFYTGRTPFSHGEKCGKTPEKRGKTRDSIYLLKVFRTNCRGMAEWVSAEKKLL